MRLMPVEGPQDAGQLTVATGSRALRLASVVRRFRFSLFPVQFHCIPDQQLQLIRLDVIGPVQPDVAHFLAVAFQ